MEKAQKAQLQIWASEVENANAATAPGVAPGAPGDGSAPAPPLSLSDSIAARSSAAAAAPATAEEEVEEEEKDDDDDDDEGGFVEAGARDFNVDDGAGSIAAQSAAAAPAAADDAADSVVAAAKVVEDSEVEDSAVEEEEEEEEENEDDDDDGDFVGAGAHTARASASSIERATHARGCRGVEVVACARDFNVDDGARSIGDVLDIAARISHSLASAATSTSSALPDADDPRVVAAAVKLQAAGRGKLARRAAADLRTEHAKAKARDHAATVITAAARGWRDRGLVRRRKRDSARAHIFMAQPTCVCNKGARGKMAMCAECFELCHLACVGQGLPVCS